MSAFNTMREKAKRSFQRLKINTSGNRANNNLHKPSSKIKSEASRSRTSFTSSSSATSPTTAAERTSTQTLHNNSSYSSGLLKGNPSVPELITSIFGPPHNHHHHHHPHHHHDYDPNQDSITNLCNLKHDQELPPTPTDEKNYTHLKNQLMIQQLYHSHHHLQPSSSSSSTSSSHHHHHENNTLTSFSNHSNHSYHSSNHSIFFQPSARNTSSTSISLSLRSKP